MRVHTKLLIVDLYKKQRDLLKEKSFTTILYYAYHIKSFNLILISSIFSDSIVSTKLFLLGAIY